METIELKEVTLTKHDIETMLQNIGIKKDSAAWADYEKAKRIVVRGQWINSKCYNKIIKWITDYVGV